VRAHIHPCHQHRTCNSEISTTYIAEGKIELVFENLVLWHSLQVPIDVFLHCGLLWIWSRNQRTFRPKKSTPSGSKGAQLRKHIDATLGSGNLREAVRLPPGEDLFEWLAVNTVDFFNQVNLLFGTLTEFCTPENCPTMSAGPKYEYRWADGVQIKKPLEVSAPKYVEYLMDWIEGQLDDESIFPQKLGAPFPVNFRDVVKTIFKRLFRVYAHIYHSHFQKIVSLKEEAHLNTCFKHFILFTHVPTLTTDPFYPFSPFFFILSPLFSDLVFCILCDLGFCS
jgi:MOB kinase activator 1